VSNAVQNRLDLSEGGSELDYVKNYLRLPDSVSVDDTLLTNLIEASEEDADEYLNNNFSEIRGQIVVGSPDNGETVSIDGETFTVALSTSVNDREFTDADGLVLCVNSDLLTVNGESVGIAHITAENDSGTVSLQTDDGVSYPDLSTSDEDELKIRYKRISLDIPENVKDGVLKLIANKYYSRVDGLESENSEHGGSGSMSWTEVKRQYLSPYRLIPT